MRPADDAIVVDTTEMTPRPPTAITAVVRASSPLITRNESGTDATISAIWAMLPDASFTPTIRGTAESLDTVDTSRFTPVRPGAL